jgi:hypothetical protein
MHVHGSFVTCKKYRCVCIIDNRDHTFFGTEIEKEREREKEKEREREREREFVCLRCNFSETKSERKNVCVWFVVQGCVC